MYTYILIYWLYIYILIIYICICIYIYIYWFIYIYIYLFIFVHTYIYIYANVYSGCMYIYTYSCCTCVQKYVYADDWKRLSSRLSSPCSENYLCFRWSIVKSPAFLNPVWQCIVINEWLIQPTTAVYHTKQMVISYFNMFWYSHYMSLHVKTTSKIRCTSEKELSWGLWLPLWHQLRDRDVGISQRKFYQARQHTRLAVMSQVWAGAKPWLMMSSGMISLVCLRWFVDFPNGKSTMTGESIRGIFEYFGGNPLSKSMLYWPVEWEISQSMRWEFLSPNQHQGRHRVFNTAQVKFSVVSK